MTKVNAYTKIQPTAYQPRSLQELMVAPQYMRQQHDQMDASIAAANQGLAQLDYFDFHDDLVSKEQKEIEDNLNQTSEELAQRGFNPSAKSDFIGLNQKYQKFLGPRGTGGKAQKVKEEALAKKQQIAEEAIKQGYSGKDADTWFNQQLQEYKSKYNTDRGIEDIPLQGMPEFGDLQKDIEKAHEKAGTKTISKMRDLGIQPQVVGNKIKWIDSTGEEVESDNIDGLQWYTQYLQEQYLAEDAPKRQGMLLRNYTPEKMAKMIESGIKAQVDYSKKTSYNRQYIDGGKANDGKTDKKTKIGTTTTQTKGLGNITDVSSLNDNIDELAKSDDPSDKLQSRELSFIKESLESKWKNSNDYLISNARIDKEFVESIENKVGVNATQLTKILDEGFWSSLNTGENYSWDEGQDGLYYLEKKTQDSAGNYRYKKIGQGLTKEEVNKFEKQGKYIKELKEKEEEFLNENIKKQGYKRVQFNFSGLDINDRKQINSQIKQTIGSGDNVTVMQLQDQKGESLNIENIGEEFFTALSNSDELKETQLIKQQGKMGYQIKFKVDDSYGYDSEIEDVKEVTGFVAINSMYDNDTGQLASEILPVLDYLPEDMQYEISKNTSMASLQQPTRDISKIGSTVKTPINRFLKGSIGEYSDERLLDFYIPEDAIDKNNPSKYKYVIPMTINENDVNNAEENALELTWGEVIPAETFDQDERFEQLINTKTVNMMMRHVNQFLNDNNPEDQKIKKLVQGDIDDKIKGLKRLLDRPIKLKSNDDMFELTNFNNLQY